MKQQKTNLTIKLLKLIGSPFDSEKVAPENCKILNFYNISVKNKIELLYLQSLKQLGKLGNLGHIYEQRKKDYEVFLRTIVRTSNLLKEKGVNAIVFKTLMPFEIIPNDIDMIILDKNAEYNAIIEFMIKNGFVVFDSVPHCTSLHDMRDIPHVDPNRKDPYDVDLYDEISANYVVYFDKSKLKTKIKTFEIDGEQAVVFYPEVDLAIQLVHSVFPEQLYTLLHYFAVLHCLSQINENVFIRVLQENHVTVPVKETLALTANLHEMAYGFVPSKLENILKSLEVTDWKRLDPFGSWTLPCRFNLMTVAKVLFEKSLEMVTLKSLALQLTKMLSPSLMQHVVRHVAIRRIRVTY